MAFLKFWKWAFWKWISENWERVAFSVVGSLLIGWALWLIYKENVTHAAAIFGLGFLSFIYANVSRFKKFKGLGFEAELWEDKKKEAANLIEQLRNIVTIYTREILLSRVQVLRLSRVDWKEEWTLFDELTSRHKELGQNVDLTGVKKIWDDYFLQAICIKSMMPLQAEINRAKQDAARKVIQNPAARELDQGKITLIEAVKTNLDDHHAAMGRGNMAAEMLELLADAKQTLKHLADLEWDASPELIEKLKKQEAICAKRPVEVTPELIAMANAD